MRKGFNQIDLVFAVMITIFLVFLSFFYTSHYIQPSLSTAESLKIEYLAGGLSETIFGDTGIPENWQWGQDFVKPGLGSCIYRVPVHLGEWNGTDNLDAFVFVYLDTEGRAYNSSVVVYDGNVKLDTELKDMSQDSFGFMDYVNVTFLVNVSSDSEKLVYIYYTGDNCTSAAYSTLSDDNNTLNVTVFSSEEYTGLTSSKMSALDAVDISEAREKFGFDYPFRLRLEKSTGDWEYGYNMTSLSTGVHRRKLLFQNSTGHIESASAITYVWK